MTVFRILAVCAPLVFFGAACSVEARTVPKTCQTLASDPIGLSIEEMVERSSDVFLATAVDYSPSDELPSHVGLYEMEVLDVVKSGSSPPVTIGRSKILGVLPYDYIPQHYLDATEQHERDGDTFRPTSFHKTDVNGECRSFFRGYIGYTYLVFLEDGEFSAFAVINDIRHDALLRQVEATQQ